LPRSLAECPTVATPKQPCLVRVGEPHGGGDPALSPPFFVCRGGPVWSVLVGAAGPRVAGEYLVQGPRLAGHRRSDADALPRRGADARVAALNAHLFEGRLTGPRSSVRLLCRPQSRLRRQG
jgi:hypothetical protein